MNPQESPWYRLLKSAGLVLRVLLVACTALLSAGVITYYLVLHDNSVERYRDLIVGSVSWADASKSIDLKYLYIFIVLLALSAFALAGGLRFVLRKAVQRRREGLLHLGLLATLLALAAVLLGTVSRTFWCILIVGCCYAAVALTRRELLRNCQKSIAGRSLTLILMGYFAGFGLATIAGRWLFPQPAIQGWLLRFPVIAAGAMTVFVLASLSLASSLEKLRVLLEKGQLGLQVPLPLCYFVFLPAYLQTASGIYRLASTIWLLLFVLALIAGAWWQLWRIYSAWKRHYRGSASFDVLFSTLAVAAIAVFVGIPLEGIPNLGSGAFSYHPYLSGDHFHVGEILLPWQQLVHFHSIPYVDFAPVHGLMAYAYGFLGSVFYDGTAASLLASQCSLFGIAVLVTVCAARPLCGALLAVLSAVPVAYVFDRDLFLAPAIFLLVNPKTLAKPIKWLAICAVVCIFSIGFNVPAGGALVLGASVAAGWILFSWIRLKGKAARRPLIVAGIIGAICIFIFFPVLLGWIGFVSDSASTNVVSNGTRFRLSFAETPIDQGIRALLRSPKFFSAVLRESWILASVWGFFALYLQLRRPKEQRSPAGLLAAWFVAIVPLVLAQYIFVRIETSGVSRSGPVTILMLATILPVLNARLLLPFRPILFLAMGYAVMAYYLPDQLRSDLQHLGWKSATLAQEVAYPPGHLMMSGYQEGLPSMGRVTADPATLTEIRTLKHALSLLLRPDETYLDLTNRQAFYYYLDLPVPQLYVPYIAASEKMQERMIAQWREDPSPVVLLAPAEVFDGGVPSLRCYRLYRELILKYFPFELDGFTFLVAPARLSGYTPPQPVRTGLLDSVFLVPDLAGLPSAWGASWSSLSDRFTKVAEVAAASEPGASGRTLVHPSASFDLGSLSLTGSRADFATVDFEIARNPGQPDPAIRTSWTAAGEPNPPRVSCLVRSPTLLLPLGAQPRWLLSDNLRTFRLDLMNPGSVRVFSTKKLTLWRLNDLKLNSVSGSQTVARHRLNRPRNWAHWPSEAALHRLHETAQELLTNETFLLPSNVIAAVAEPTLMKQPDQKFAVFAHAPAELFLPLEGRPQTLSVGFGILPGAYTNGNRTDGVLFKVWLQTEDKMKILLWSRMLNPLEQVQDRGTQWAKIPIVPRKGARIILETDPGGNNNCDWSYWEDVRKE